MLAVFVPSRRELRYTAAVPRADIFDKKVGKRASFWFLRLIFSDRSSPEGVEGRSEKQKSEYESGSFVLFLFLIAGNLPARLLMTAFYYCTAPTA